MKKNLLRLASLLMAAALTFSAAGCGGAKEENAAPTETTEYSVSAETEEAAAEIRIAVEVNAVDSAAVVDEHEIPGQLNDLCAHIRSIF